MTTKKRKRAARKSEAACWHIRPREVGQTMDGLGTVIVYWCPACGALKRTMNNWRYTDWPWEKPSASAPREAGAVAPSLEADVGQEVTP